MNTPLLSFISPNYNRAKFIGATLDSLLAQSDPRWENVIVDDGSTDDSIEIIDSYVKRDPRFRFYRRDREPKGACPCRNIGVEHARGRYLVFLDTDDLAAPHCAEQRIREMESRPEIDFGVFQAQQFQNQPGDLGVWWNVDKPEVDELSRQFRQDALCQGTGPAFRKNSFDRVGRWDQTLTLWQDIDLFFRLFIQEYRYAKFFHLPADVHIREFRGSISRSDFYARHKMESRFKVVTTAVRMLVENGMAGRVREARFMTTELIDGSWRANHFDLARELSLWAVENGVLTARECRILRLLHWARRSRLERFRSVSNWFARMLTSVQCSRSTIGRVALSEPAIALI